MDDTSPMFGSAQPDHATPVENGQKIPPPSTAPENGARALDENDLQAALQLLVERAQYVTGATGAALALLEGEEMVCRASTGRSAPAVGARLQVRSGLTGESISRRQLLRCDNAEADARVNLEACRELGIASIVVMPLLTRSGAARGLFELFSDHPYAFEERDLIALERMAELTRTALDLPAKLPGSSVALGQRNDVPVAEHTIEASGTNAAPATDSAQPPDMSQLEPRNLPELALLPETLPESLIPPLDVPATGSATVSLAKAEVATASPGTVPDAMRRIQKCASCGFPVSEGRSLCLDCEKLEHEKPERENKVREPQEDLTKELAPSVTAEPAVAQFVPRFLADAAPQNPSWLADHVNLLAIVVLILCIVVAVVVFR